MTFGKLSRYHSLPQATTAYQDLPRGFRERLRVLGYQRLL